jgi:hypothetical protein
MYALRKTLLGFASLASLAALQANAATLVPITPPAGAASAIVFGINKHNVIAGEYVDGNGLEHGFIGPLNGTYTIFDYGGTSTATEPRAINDDGDVNGFALDPSFTIGEQFLRKADGTVLTLEKNGVPLDGIAQGITKKRTSSTGDYVDPNTGTITGYTAQNGAYKSDVDLGLTVTRTSPRAINKFGTLAGFYLDSGGASHGFILKNGIAQVVDADGSGTTSLEGINKKGLATGFVADADGNRHAFIYDSAKGEFTSIEIPDGSPFTEAWGINDQGMIGTSTAVGTYIYCIRDVHCPDGGTAIADGRTWKAKPGASLRYDGNGRTGVKAPKGQRPARRPLQ